MEKPVSSEVKAQKKPSKAKPVPKPKTHEPTETEIRLAATPLQYDFLRSYAEQTSRSVKQVVAEAVKEYMKKHSDKLAKLEQEAAALEAQNTERAAAKLEAQTKKEE